LKNQYHQKRYRRLRGAMVAVGVDQAGIASLLKLSPTSISNRFRGYQDWRSGEMYSVLSYLGISKPEVVLGYYFPPDGIDPEVGDCPC
jgi:hypothetical protein